MDPRSGSGHCQAPPLETPAGTSGVPGRHLTAAFGGRPGGRGAGLSRWAGCSETSGAGGSSTEVLCIMKLRGKSGGTPGGSATRAGHQHRHRTGRDAGALGIGTAGHDDRHARPQHHAGGIRAGRKANRLATMSEQDHVPDEALTAWASVPVRATAGLAPKIAGGDQLPEEGRRAVFRIAEFLVERLHHRQ